MFKLIFLVNNPNGEGFVILQIVIEMWEESMHYRMIADELGKSPSALQEYRKAASQIMG